MFYGGLENTGGTLGQQYPFESTSSYIAPTCIFGSPCNTNGITLPAGFANLAGPGPQSPVSLPTLVGKDANYRDGYSEQWNLMTQYAVSGSVSATIGYVGSVGRRMHLNPTSTGFNAPAVLAAPGVNTKPYSAFPQLGTIVTTFTREQLVIMRFRPLLRNASHPVSASLRAIPTHIRSIMAILVWEIRHSET